MHLHSLQCLAARPSFGQKTHCRHIIALIALRSGQSVDSIQLRNQSQFRCWFADTKRELHRSAPHCSMEWLSNALGLRSRRQRVPCWSAPQFVTGSSRPGRTARLKQGTCKGNATYAIELACSANHGKPRMCPSCVVYSMHCSPPCNTVERTS